MACPPAPCRGRPPSLLAICAKCCGRLLLLIASTHARPCAADMSSGGSDSSESSGDDASGSYDGEEEDDEYETYDEDGSEYDEGEDELTDDDSSLPPLSSDAADDMPSLSSDDDVPALSSGSMSASDDDDGDDEEPEHTKFAHKGPQQPTSGLKSGFYNQPAGKPAAATAPTASGGPAAYPQASRSLLCACFVPCTISFVLSMAGLFWGSFSCHCAEDSRTWQPICAAVLH